MLTILLQFYKGSQPTHSSFAILELLLEVCETISTKSLQDNSCQGLEDYKGFLDIIHWRIRNIPIATTNTDEDPNAKEIMELFQLATLVYLERASGTQPNKIHYHLDRAFTIFSQLKLCEPLLPLFLLGCEARSDNERVIVLDLIDRTPNSTLLQCAKSVIQCLWIQDDLTKKEFDYLDKIGAVLSKCHIMMIFV